MHSKVAMAALALTLVVAGQSSVAPAKATPAAEAAADAKEADAAKALTALFNDPTTPSATFQSALDAFVTTYPGSKLMLPALVLGVRYYRAHHAYGPLLHFGLEALKADPNDLYTLSSLGTAIPNNVKDSDLNREQLLELAAGFDRKIIAEVNTWLITANGLDWGGRHYTQAQANVLRANLAGPAHVSLGRIASMLQQYPQAVTSLREALVYERTQGEKAQVYFDIGVAEAAQGHNPEAQAAFDQAKQLVPPSAMLQRLIRNEEARLSGGPGAR